MESADLHIVQRARRFSTRTAVSDAAGDYTYGDLLDASSRIAAALLAGKSDLEEARVAFLVPPGFEYAAVQWGVWRAGGVAVPLGLRHPLPELEYVIDDTDAAVVIADPEFIDTVRALAKKREVRRLSTEDALAAETCDLAAIAPTRRAMILYTSGTTGKPKGVVTTHANIRAQVESLVEAWEWTDEDSILHVLPLHHIHGIINVLSCALWSGARCEMARRFDADEVWERFTRGGLSLFMAVPTIYAKLISAWGAASPDDQARFAAGARKLRLMVSGSAALPVPTLEKWKEITGHVLLERYGMTEIGMALSNPLHGERRPGCVGTPLPQVEVRLAGPNAVPSTGDGKDGRNKMPSHDGEGEIEVRGPTVYLEYWNRPEATAAAFRDGWFRTGDVAVVEDGAYRILGRRSVDIIKTGGYKVSALEIENALREHPAIADCAVVGVPDEEWGERVAAAVVARSDVGESDSSLASNALRAWAKVRLAEYKAPTLFHLVADLPRNAMGKVNKPAVRKLFQ